MLTTADVDTIQIVLQAQEKVLLHIVCSRDGRIERMGNGRLANEEQTLVRGTINPPVFDELLQHLPRDFFASTGSYADPNSRGQQMGLNLVAKGSKGEVVLQFVYGSDSAGPPDDVVQFVATARRITEGWYRSQLGR